MTTDSGPGDRPDPGHGAEPGEGHEPTTPLYLGPTSTGPGESQDGPPSPSAYPGPDQPPYPQPGSQPYPQPGQQPSPLPGAASYPPAPGQPGYPYAWPPDHPKASTALVLGLIGLGGALLCLPIVVSPFAWFIGSRTLREIRASGGRWGGESTAKAGMVLGIIGTVLMVLGLLLLGIAIVALVVFSASVDGGADYSDNDPFSTALTLLLRPS